MESKVGKAWSKWSDLAGGDLSIVHSKNRLVETTTKLVEMCLTKTFG